MFYVDISNKKTAYSDKFEEKKRGDDYGMKLFINFKENVKAFSDEPDRCKAILMDWVRLQVYLCTPGASVFNNDIDLTKLFTLCEAISFSVKLSSDYDGTIFEYTDISEIFCFSELLFDCFEFNLNDPNDPLFDSGFPRLIAMSFEKVNHILPSVISFETIKTANMIDRMFNLIAQKWEDSFYKCITVILEIEAKNVDQIRLSRIIQNERVGNQIVSEDSQKLNFLSGGLRYLKSVSKSFSDFQKFTIYDLEFYPKQYFVDKIVLIIKQCLAQMILDKPVNESSKSAAKEVPVRPTVALQRIESFLYFLIDATRDLNIDILDLYKLILQEERCKTFGTDGVQQIYYRKSSKRDKTMLPILPESDCTSTSFTATFVVIP
ncbi:hypothetical protein ROZALSC1DRAFT_28352 [Rozella allomycis CSF55]|uniref:Uncharacterized protein n=1 Tax=Rozella allomycis (strain CSF55) TaxID=988480 RepID=A0A4P9YKY1_ROZAC|nr:hypothetical protein ROZALSC1DRAFT_28352 [Rozella allomycis CSF55]